MKKIICVLVLLLVIFSLYSCAETVKITRFEEYPRAIGGYSYVGKVSNERVLKYCYEKLKRNGEFSLFIPREGQFVTDDGEEFVSVIKENSMIYSSQITFTLCFTLEIYSADNELIVSEEIKCNQSRYDIPPEEPDISEKMLKYWNCVKLPADEYFRDWE